MTTKTSIELRKEIGEIKGKIRYLHRQREQARTRQRETVAGNLEWMDLDDLVKELDAQLPGLMDQRRKVERELVRALTAEVQAERPMLEDAKMKLKPQVDKILARVRAQCDQAAAELVELSKPLYPEGKQLPDITISPNLGTVKSEYHPEDNAVDLIISPLSWDLASKRTEAQQITDSLNAEIGRR